jgi:hypothetical protein
MINNKKRLFEVFEKVNKLNLKEWYDDEYHQKPKQSKGIGGFGNIDWQILHEQLMVNTELLAAGKTSEGNLMAVNVGDFTDYDGMLSHDELKHLEAFDLIAMNGAFPVIDNEQYKDYNTFKAKAMEIWGKETPIQTQSSDSEAPYLRGREDSNVSM